MYCTFVLIVSNPEDEIVTHGSLYKFDMMNSLVISHFGEILLSPNWWNKLFSNLGCWKEERWGYLSMKFQTYKNRNFEDTLETISGISVEEIGKLGLPVSGASLHCFQKRSTLDNSPWRDIYFYPIRSEIFQALKIRVSLTNPRSTSSGTRTDTSNR